MTRAGLLTAVICVGLSLPGLSLAAPPPRAEPAPKPARRAAPREAPAKPRERAADRPRPRPKRLRPVVVTSTRVSEPVADSAVRREVVGPTRLQEKRARTLAEALQEHPGVAVGSQLYYERGHPTGLQIRGCDPRRLLVVMDGRRLFGLFDGIVDVSQLSLAGVHRVEIIKGPSSVLYGSDALCGVVNLYSRRLPRSGYRLDALAEYGSYNSHQVRLDFGARPGRRWAFGVGAEVRGRDGFDLDPSTPLTDGDRIRSVLTAARVHALPLPRLRLNLQLRYGFELREGVLSDPTGNEEVIYDSRIRYHRPSAMLSAEYRFNATDRLILRSDYQLFLRESVEDEVDSASKRTRVTRAHLVDVGLYGRVMLGTWNLLMAGLELHHEVLNVDRHEHVAEPGEDPFDVRAPEVDDKGVTRVELFVQDELTPWKWLTLVPGVRYTWHDRFGHHVTPKVSALFDPLGWLRLRISYGHGFRAPTLKNLYYHFDHSELGFPFVVMGNPDLAPELADAVSGGVELRPAPGVLIQAAGFFTDYRDLIMPTDLEWHEDGYFFITQQNVARARTWGGEAGVRVPLHRWISASTSYTLLYGRDEDTGEELPNIPRHQLKTALRFHHPGWGTRVGVWLFYQDRVWVDASNSERSRGHLTLNAYVEQRIYRGLVAYLRGINLTNAHRDGANPLDLRPQPGWQLLGGLRWVLRKR